MDETHLRWFTKVTAERMFDDAGFKVVRAEPIWIEMPFDSRVSLKAPQLMPAKARLNARLRAKSPEAFAAQFIWLLEPRA